MNPQGFSEKNEEKSWDKLKSLNESREKINKSIQKFRREFRGTPARMAKAVVALLDDLSVSQRLKACYCGENATLEFSDDMRQSYDIVMQILDGIVKCLPEKEITPEDFITNWNLSVNSIKFGSIPQMLDEVTFGEADRIKPSRPKIAFIIGANEGEFPKSIKTAGIFAGNEREILRESGLEIFNTDLTAAIDEDYLVYMSLCCATERLFITYSLYEDNGISKEPSEIVNSITECFGDKLNFLYEPQETLDCGNIPETVRTAVSRMCISFSTDKAAYAAIEGVLKEKCSITAEKYINTANKQHSSLLGETAKRLYGSKIKMSATKFDTFHKCKFAFFCKYGIGAKRLQQASFDVLQRGTIVHYVLENIITEFGKSIAELSREKCDKLVDYYIKKYLSLIKGFEKLLNKRMRYIISKISLLIKDVVYHMVKEFEQSDFKPKYCELKIGSEEGVPEKIVKIGNDAEFRINGSIDRIDIWNGYVRVIDYKTGTKVFSLSDILVGLNMQMLIYMYSLMRSENNEFRSLMSAGVLYAPSKRDSYKNPLVMNGIILDNEQVYKAMEKDNLGEFVPKHEYSSKGELKGSTYISEEIFEVIFDYIEKLMIDMGKELLDGCAQAIPTEAGSTNACKYCDYYPVCCLETGKRNNAEKFANNVVLKKMKEVL